MTVQADSNIALARKRSALADKRAEALRANLKRRKEQSSARDNAPSETGEMTAEKPNETR